MFLPFDLFLLISFSILATIDNISFNSQCADQLQRCGLLLEEFERQLHDLKNNAFRSCFPKSCIHEKVAFDECFTKSLQAVRGPLFDNPLFVQNDFLSAAEDFQSELQKCFDNGDTSLSEDHVEFNATSRGNTELEDQLWGLPNGELDKKNKELTICNLKNGNNRVFGGGISRIAPQHMAPDQLNNLTATCSLNVSELSCFKRTLDYDPQYRSLMSTKERTLLSCIQNTRLRSEANCQIMSFTKMRSCICNARQAVDSRMQSILLDCVQHSSVAQLYAALVSLSFDSSLQQQTISPTRLKPTTDATNIPPLPETSFQGEEPISLPSNGAVLTQGSIVNGQCLCACTQKYIEPSSSKLISIQSNSDFTSNQQAKAKLPVSNLPVLSPIINQQNLIGYPASSSMPWYFQPVQTALSAEAGIANGFERFFNGQPPLKRK